MGHAALGLVASAVELRKPIGLGAALAELCGTAGGLEASGWAAAVGKMAEIGAAFWC